MAQIQAGRQKNCHPDLQSPRPTLRRRRTTSTCWMAWQPGGTGGYPRGLPAGGGRHPTPACGSTARTEVQRKREASQKRIRKKRPACWPLWGLFRRVKPLALTVMAACRAAGRGRLSPAPCITVLERLHCWTAACPACPSALAPFACCCRSYAAACCTMPSRGCNHFIAFAALIRDKVFGAALAS